MTKQRANQAIAEMFNPDGSLKYGGVTYKVLKRERDKASKWINNEHPEIVQRMADGRVEIIDGMIRELGQNDKLTRNLLSTILYEGVKPAFGAGIGGAVGAFLTDPDDEESNLAMNLAIGGFTLGLLQKRLQANPYIKGDMKEKAFGILENQGAIALHNFLKVHTAGTMAAKLNAYGGPLETLSKLLFHQQMGSTRGILGAEHAADVLELKFFQAINEKVIQQASPELYNPAWRIIRGLESEADAVRRLNLNALDQKNLKQLIKNTEEFRTDNIEPINEEISALEKRISEISILLKDVLPDLLKTTRKKERNAKYKAVLGEQRNDAQTLKRYLLSETDENWICPYHNEKADRETAEADHIHPVSKGGQSTLQNMVLICYDCNRGKGDSTLRNFCKVKGFIFEEVCERLESDGKEI